MKRIAITIGVPGSGKSTFAKMFVSGSELPVVYINADSVRKELYGDESIQGSGKDVFERVFEKFRDALTSPDDCVIVVDNTSIDYKARKSYYDIADECGIPNENITLLYFDVPLAEAIRRNENRERQVPPHVITRMFANMEEPTELEKSKYNVRVIK